MAPLRLRCVKSDVACAQALGPLARLKPGPTPTGGLAQMQLSDHLHGVSETGGSSGVGAWEPLDTGNARQPEEHLETTTGHSLFAIDPGSMSQESAHSCCENTSPGFRHFFRRLAEIVVTVAGARAGRSVNRPRRQENAPRDGSKRQHGIERRPPPSASRRVGRNAQQRSTAIVERPHGSLGLATSLGTTGTA